MSEEQADRIIELLEAMVVSQRAILHLATGANMPPSKAQAKKAPNWTAIYKARRGLEEQLAYHDELLKKAMGDPASEMPKLRTREDVEAMSQRMISRLAELRANHGPDTDIRDLAGRA